MTATKRAVKRKGRPVTREAPGSGKTRSTKCRDIAAAKTATRKRGEDKGAVDQRRDRVSAGDVFLDHRGRAEACTGPR